VGGTPSSLALHLINELEPHRRGWYSGTVGYIGTRETEFAVAIRCALLQDNTVRLYSGAGIVPGSEPDAEWQELESKIRTVLSLFE
jgi:menaquinone-specific isochorismate synthase